MIAALQVLGLDGSVQVGIRGLATGLVSRVSGACDDEYGETTVRLERMTRMNCKVLVTVGQNWTHEVGDNDVRVTYLHNFSESLALLKVAESREESGVYNTNRVARESVKPCFRSHVMEQDVWWRQEERFLGSSCSRLC